MIGTRLGPFTILRPHGERGTRCLYVAERAVRGTQHTLKVVPVSPPAPPPDPAPRDRNEVHPRCVAGARRHRDVLVVHDVGLANGVLYMVLGELESESDPARDPGGSRYQLGDQLGSGGMAEVFAGTMKGVEGFARQVAIKRVLTGLSQVPAFAAMFVAEAQIASRLAHPNIVSVLDFSRDPEDRLLLVMEYVEGRNLASLRAAGPIPPPIALFIVVELLRGLGYAHDLPDPLGGPADGASAPRGVVHRDVSPQNVLLSYEGAVKVSDFGLAKVRQSDGVCSDTVRGKPSYMSPEQVAGEPLDGRTDLFAVGVMLWEMLAHRPLFAGTTREILGQVLFRDIAAPSTLRGGVPGDLEAIAMKLLARKRHDRYPTAEAAIDALLRCDAVPRDGRGDLAHLLAERFPRACRSRLQRTTGAAPTGTPGARREEPITLPDPPSVPVVLVDVVAPGARAAAVVPRAYAGPHRGVFAATLSGVAVVVASVLVISRGEVAQSGTTDRLAAPREVVAEPASVPRAGPRSPLPSPAARPSPSLSLSPSPSAMLPGARGELTPIDAWSETMQLDPEATAGTGERAPARRAPIHRDRGHAAGTGELAIIVKPWAMIWLNGKPSGQTPFRAPVPAGRYRVRLVNDDIAHNETTTVTVEPGRTATVERSW